MQGGDGALLLVDLAAAFPSLSQECLFKVPERQKVPAEFLTARQGCPLSPVLFALALDPFLCHLMRALLSDTLIRAYADDMAIVLASRSSLPPVARCFDVLANAAALRVNVAKTEYVPLYQTTVQQANYDIAYCIWSNMRVSMGYGKYLGYCVGPQASADLNFKQPMQKFRARAAYWLSLRKLGSYFQVLGFNMCALSVLTFACQLHLMPEPLRKELCEPAWFSTVSTWSSLFTILNMFNNYFNCFNLFTNQNPRYKYISDTHHFENNTILLSYHVLAHLGTVPVGKAAAQQNGGGKYVKRKPQCQPAHLPRIKEEAKPSASSILSRLMRAGSSFLLRRQGWQAR